MLDAVSLFSQVLTPLLGFDFGTSGMLWFLAAASAPILIHLWNRRERKVINWAAMEYLLAAIEKKSRRIQVENWLLLLVRTLLVVLVALAVAKPFFEGLGTARSSTARAFKVLVVDASYSMAAADGDTDRFQRAKAMAASIVEQSPQGDGFALVLLADPPQVVIGNPVFDPANVIAEIEKLRLTHGGGNLPGTLQRVQDLFATVRREHPELESSEAIFITDLGRTSWDLSFPTEQAESEFRSQLLGLARLGALAVVDVGDAGRENVVATGLRMSGSYATASEDMQFEASFQNVGRQAAVGRRVQWLVDGRGVAESTLDLEAGEQASVPLRYRFESAGLHTLEARTSDDLLNLDNRRFLVIPVKREVRVLAIDGRPSGAPFSTGADYLKAAFESGGVAGNRGVAGEAIEVEVGSPAALTDRDLGRYDAIFLSNVARFSKAESRVMRDYVLGGGGLVFFLGDRVDPENYNQRLAGGDDPGLRIFPARITSEQAFDPTQQPVVLDPHDYRHPILSVFRDNEQVGFLRTPIYRYWGLEMPQPSAAQTALSLTNGAPLIVSEDFGAGVTIVVATPAEVAPSQPWNLLPALQNFVPLVRELLKTAMLGQFEHRNLEVGQMLTGAAPRSAISERVNIKTPDGDAAWAVVNRQGDAAQWSYGPTVQAGLYSASVPGEPDPQWFAANLDTRESDLARLEPQELLTSHFAGITLPIRSTWQPQSRATSETLVSAPQYIYGWLLLAALVLLFADTFLSWFFGSRQA